MTVYRKSDIEAMARAVASYLDGMLESQVCDEFYVPNCNTLFSWAYDAAVRQTIRAERSWSGDQYNEALHARRTETKADALICYLTQPGVSQFDIVHRYSSKTCGGIRKWYEDTAVIALVMEKTGLSEEQLDNMWSEKASKRTPMTITNYSRRFNARKNA